MVGVDKVANCCLYPELLPGQVEDIISLFDHLGIDLPVADDDHVAELVVDDGPGKSRSISAAVSSSPLQCVILDLIVCKFPGIYIPKEVALYLLPVGDEVGNDVPVGVTVLN